MDYQQICKDVVYLCAYAINNDKPDPNRIKGMDLAAINDFSSAHMISAVVAFALEGAGYKTRQTSSVIAAVMKKTALFDREWSIIRSKLQEASIWYMPIKGAVLKDMYPKYGMREFSDYDILFDANYAEKVKEIMEGLDFESKHFGSSHHDCYYKNSVLNFEMHRALFGPTHEEKLYEYYQDMKMRLIGDGYEKHFSPEDFYLYMIAHEYKHYSGGGTGLRSLLDTYVYLSKTSLNMDYVTGEAEKLGIREFEEKNRSLSQHLFSGETLTDADQEMLDYILSSGTYGTITHRVENKMRKKGWSKIRYALDRFFVPVSRKNKDYAAYAGQYPFFYKHKILLPILPFYRTFRAMKGGRFSAEAKAIQQAKGNI